MKKGNLNYYIPNPKIIDAIKRRLAELLNVDDPAEVLASMVEQRLNNFPDECYSTAEDMVVQEIIIHFQDKKLDQLWLIYNVGYFEHDTKKFLSLFKD